MMVILPGTLLCLLLGCVGFCVGRGVGFRSIPSVFVCVLGVITVSGYAVSALDLFGNIWAWCAACFALSLPLVGLSLRRRQGAVMGTPPRPARVQSFGAPTWPLWLLVGVTVVAGVLQLVLIVATAPDNVDSMTYHMARVGYYLQHGNIASFASNFWAQVMHAKNSAIVMSFLVLVAHGWSNAAQLLQYFSWLVLIAAMYGICRLIGVERRAATIGSLAGGLIVEVLLEATTTQDDLYIGALCACYVLFALSFLEQGGRRDLVLAAVSAGLAFGTKISSIMLLVPASFLLLLHGWGAAGIKPDRARVRRLTCVAGACIAGCMVFGLPAGYWENWRIYGSPLGDPRVIESKALGASTIEDRVAFGVVNSARYALDFIDPSGLPDTAADLDLARQTKAAALRAIKNLGIDVDQAPTVAPPYEALRTPVLQAHEDFSYWGLWAWLFFLPATIVSLVCARYRKVAIFFVLSGGLFWILQAFGAVYDPWRGRYFIQAAIFAIPPTAIGVSAISRRAMGRLLLFIALIPCCLISINSIWSRRGSPWLAAIKMDWNEQVTRNTPELRPVIARLDAHVGQNVPLIVSLRSAYSEFPLFGRKMTRRLYPAPDHATFSRLVREHKARFVVFNQVLQPRPTDCSLGSGFFLADVYGLPISQCEPTWPERLNDLRKVQAALVAYHRDHGGYPVSIGWDGFLSHMGDPSPIWIKGLVPQYLSKLPYSRRTAKDDWAMYVYRSDGRDYKLLVVAANDDNGVLRFAPGRIDPASGQKAYGFWSDGARDWPAPR